MKKKAALQKKLLLDKNIIASLSKDKQYMIAGGAPVTMNPRCQTWAETCQTIPYTQNACVPCMV